jgi:hypothetical protein
VGICCDTGGEPDVSCQLVVDALHARGAPVATSSVRALRTSSRPASVGPATKTDSGTPTRASRGTWDPPAR